MKKKVLVTYDDLDLSQVFAGNSATEVFEKLVSVKENFLILLKDRKINITNGEVVFGYNGYGNVVIEFWREETDAEYQKRLKDVEKVEKKKLQAMVNRWGIRYVSNSCSLW